MIKNLMAMVCVFGLFACATATPEPEIIEQDIVFEQPRPTPTRNVDIAAIFSNENVMVFPVKGPINDNMAALNRYRGVLDNTTAGGYTVFDPSVTVFAVDQKQGIRPSFIPEYSVPKHAAQYITMEDVFPSAPMESMAADEQPQSILSEPLTPSSPVMQPQNTQPRRSPPLLTGY